MQSRCPSSTLHKPSLAYLSDHKWVISPRGYANVVATSLENVKPRAKRQPARSRDVVWGILYTLEPDDEEYLDLCEGVSAGCYEKHEMMVHLMKENGVEGTLSALVYMDPRQAEGEPMEEYVGRMNEGIKDALKLGMDGKWIEEVIRKFIPE